jgi:hypothetical protein
VEKAYIYLNSEPVAEILAERLRRLGYEPVVDVAFTLPTAEAIMKSAEPGALLFTSTDTLDALKAAGRGPTVYLTFDAAAAYRARAAEEDVVAAFELALTAAMDLIQDAFAPYVRRGLSRSELESVVKEFARLKVFHVHELKSLSVDEFVEELKRAAEAGYTIAAFGEELRRAIEYIAEIRGVNIRVEAPPAKNAVMVNPLMWLEAASYKGGTAFFIPMNTLRRTVKEGIALAVEWGRVVKAVADVYTFKFDEVDKAIAAAKAVYSSSMRI